MAFWRKRSKPVDAFRHSVLPLGIFMCMVGTLFMVLAMVSPADRILLAEDDFISDPTQFRVFAGSWGALGAIVGAGLCMRRYWAWIAMLLIFAVGACAPAVWGVHQIVSGEATYRALLGRLLGGIPMLLFAIGVYFVTRPAFSRDQIKAGSTKT